jgi:hypothetical protein
MLEEWRVEVREWEEGGEGLDVLGVSNVLAGGDDPQIGNESARKGIDDESPQQTPTHFMRNQRVLLQVRWCRLDLCGINKCRNDEIVNLNHQLVKHQSG